MAASLDVSPTTGSQSDDTYFCDFPTCCTFLGAYRATNIELYTTTKMSHKKQMSHFGGQRKNNTQDKTVFIKRALAQMFYQCYLHRVAKKQVIILARSFVS